TLINSGINAANNFICYPFLKMHGCLIKKMFLNLKDFAGTSPHTPSLTCDAAGAGGTAQKARALPPALAAECILLAGRQGVSKKIYKDDKAVFTNLSGRPPPALAQVTEARRCCAC
ncbi:TPA: hypothetical protein ACXIO2_002150, partial [Neisseria meningitidis]